jgi:hypothetical protein
VYVCVLYLEARVVHITCFGTRASIATGMVGNGSHRRGIELLFPLLETDGSCLGPLPSASAIRTIRPDVLHIGSLSCTRSTFAAQRVLSLKRATCAVYQLIRRADLLDLTPPQPAQSAPPQGTSVHGRHRFVRFQEFSVGTKRS